MVCFLSIPRSNNFLDFFLGQAPQLKVAEGKIPSNFWYDVAAAAVPVLRNSLPTHSTPLNGTRDMATSLAAQLAQIAAKSRSSLNVKAQKAAHTKSLIFEPRIAAGQSYQTIYTACRDGFEELCQLDARFTPFSNTLFSEQSQDEDRSQMTQAENKELDRRVDSFLRLVGSRLRLMPAIKAIEWLIRRFR